MGDGTSGAECANCGKPRDPQDKTPCPSCGERKKNYVMKAEPGEYRMRGGGAGLVHAFVEIHPAWRAVGVVAFLVDVGISLSAPMLPPILGIPATIAVAYVGHLAGQRSEREVRRVA